MRLFAVVALLSAGPIAAAEPVAGSWITASRDGASTAKPSRAYQSRSPVTLRQMARSCLGCVASSASIPPVL